MVSACGNKLSGRRHILPAAHAAVIPAGRYALLQNVLLRLRLNVLLHILLLLLDDPRLLLLPGCQLSRLFLLPCQLLLFGAFTFRLLLFPAPSGLSGQQIPDPGRRQVHRHQKAQCRQNEHDECTQHRPEVFPQRPGQDRPDGAAA